ncbi:nuclear transport factor 2 family protein [Pseudomonas sp. A46]|jgi:hypothetical protein|nr:nuclear transport factor 2 family protein [Pseudomonas sp. A46]OWJ95832.1 hypothetical protein B6S59_08865 [Pseudomonas sp. A46]
MNAENAAHNAIRQLVRDYVEGMVRADESLLRLAFHPNARIIGRFQALPEWLTLDDFVDAIRDRGPVLAPEQSPFWQIVSQDVTDETAMVKVLDDYAGLRFTDYLSLMVLDGRWRIVSKLFHCHS